MDRPTIGIVVDASYQLSKGILQYRGCNLATGQQLFLNVHTGLTFPHLTNAGEFLALVEGLKVAGDLPVYSDSKVAIQWVKHEYFNTHIPQTDWLYQQMQDALLYVRSGQARTSNIEKWETKLWGCNPSDFGLKGNSKDPNIFPINSIY